jgi:hypothetical protein
MPSKKTKAPAADQDASQEAKVEETLQTTPQNSDDDEDAASVGSIPSKPSKPKAFTSSSLLDAMTQPTTTTTSSTTTHSSFPSSFLPSSSSSSMPSSAGFSTPDPNFAKFFKPTEAISSSALVDIPNVYLYDRSGWTEFKKILNECGGTWNLPHWMTTIVRGGEEWVNMLTEGHAVDKIFPVGKAGMEAKSTDLASKLIASLGLPKNLGENIRHDVQYCCLLTLEFEDSRRLPARQKMWAWLTKSLKGTRPTVGPYHYLVDEVKAYGIAALFKRLVNVLEQITICSLDDELEKVLSVSFDPNKQNIFSYLGELRKAVKGLHDLNERLPENVELHSGKSVKYLSQASLLTESSPLMSQAKKGHFWNILRT